MSLSSRSFSRPQQTFTDKTSPWGTVDYEFYTRKLHMHYEPVDRDRTPDSITISPTIMLDKM